MSRILKNTTMSDIFIADTGTVLPANSSYTIYPDMWPLWASSSNIEAYINNGNVVVNDGIVDLIPYFGLSLIKFGSHETSLMDARYQRELCGFVYDLGEYAYQHSTISFDNTSRTLSHSVKAPKTQFEFLIDNIQFIKTTTQTVPITDTEGVWFFYYNSSGTLTASQSPGDLFAGKAYVANLYWDSTNKRAITLGDERHGLVMDWNTHRYLHETEGTKVGTKAGTLVIGNYIDNGDGSLNSHATFSVTDGIIYDEDLAIPIKHSATPTNPFEQILTTVAKVPVFYLSGAGLWRRKDPTDYGFIEGSASPLQTAKYNMYSGGTWSLQNCTDGYFFAVWLVYTNDLQYPVATVLGQREDPDLISSINKNIRLDLVITNLFSQEKYFYKKLVFQTSTSYANVPKARLRYVAAASEINPSNDRYSVICAYNGNAGVGKYLDFYSGQSSDTSPFPIPEISYARTITLTSTAPSTCTISFYEFNDLNTVLFSISLNNSIYSKVNLTYLLQADWKLVAKVASGSINKPAITLFIQTSL